MTFQVNVLKPGDGIVLSIADKNPDELVAKKKELIDILQSQSGLVVNIDRMVPGMELYNNGTCCKSKAKGTDIYFHATDPSTNRVLGFDSQKVQSTISGKKPASDLKYTISGRLGVQAKDIHKPYPGLDMWTAGQGHENAAPVKSSGSSNFSGYPGVLIAFGCLVFALTLVALVYLCSIRRKMKATEETNTKMIVIPRYEPVFIEPNLKEYETQVRMHKMQVIMKPLPFLLLLFFSSEQVLQMSVPVDDDGFPRSNDRDKEFNLDSISYITKDRLSSSRESLTNR